MTIEIQDIFETQRKAQLFLSLSLVSLILGNEMEAIRKQATKLREQVAKQQQVHMIVCILYMCL